MELRVKELALEHLIFQLLISLLEKEDLAVARCGDRVSVIFNFVREVDFVDQDTFLVVDLVLLLVLIEGYNGCELVLLDFWSHLRWLLVACDLL